MRFMQQTAPPQGTTQFGVVAGKSACEQRAGSSALGLAEITALMSMAVDWLCRVAVLVVGGGGVRCGGHGVRP